MFWFPYQSSELVRDAILSTVSALPAHCEQVWMELPTVEAYYLNLAVLYHLKTSLGIVKNDAQCTFGIEDTLYL